MKTGADFDTNSSSRYYISLEITMDDGRTIHLDPDKSAGYEGCDNLYQTEATILDRFLSMRSMQELLSFLNLDESAFDTDISRIRYKRIISIEVGKMQLLQGEYVDPEDEWLMEQFMEEHEVFLKEMAEMEGTEYDPDSIDWAEELEKYWDPCIVGNMEYYDLRNREVESYTIVEGL